MAVAKTTYGARKSDRIRAHVADLKGIILSRYPRVRIEEAPVPESRWPGIWVYGEIECAWDLYDLVRDTREEFFRREMMDVHVVVAGRDRNGG